MSDDFWLDQAEKLVKLEPAEREQVLETYDERTQASLRTCLDLNKSRQAATEQMRRLFPGSSDPKGEK
jgi:hypothetical protein